ncbi:6442_t:CDS:2 [Scutellospora calospora]|uniref:6442_t:CDS:1 n=1 Tax=Scutellospora calospora TaxID=85575 RepID=A0ACA9JVE1_9GLOM|nr:6442_t:CDS:2 [Scutellospora calospora]
MTIFEKQQNWHNQKEYLNMSNTLEYLNTTAKDISYLQTLMDTISKGIIDKIILLLPKKKKNTSSNTDNIDKITNSYHLGSMHEQELEKKLYTALKSKTKVNNLSKKLQNISRSIGSLSQGPKGL